MSYGNYAPFYRTGYFNPMQPPTMPHMADGQNQFAQPYQPPSPANNDTIWVQGESGAKAYLVAPNNTVTLWDSESPTIYVKSADMNGIPSMRILDFTERTVNAPKTPTEHVCGCEGKYPKMEEFKALQSQIANILTDVEGLKEQYKSFTAETLTKTTKTSKGADE